MLSKSSPLLNNKICSLYLLLRILNLPFSDYLSSTLVTFKWAVFMYLLYAETVKNYEYVFLMFLNMYSLI